MKDIFLEIEKIKKIYDKDKYTVIVFGTSEYSKNIFEMLEVFNIKVKYFSDNNHKKWNENFCDRLIINPNKIKKIDNAFVVIGTGFFKGIYEQIISMDVEHVYAIIDAPKYSAYEMIEEKKALKEYFDNYEENSSNKILVKAMDFIGDNILRLGIFKAMIDKFGKENIYFVVLNNGAHELIKLFTENIIVINKKEFINKKEYRLKILKNINSLYFKSSISFYTKFAYTTTDLLNEYNTNIKTNYISDNFSYSKYIVDESVEFFCNTYELEQKLSYYPKNNMPSLNDNIKYKLPDEYIVIGMGASSTKRMYDVIKFAKVVNYLLDNNYNIIIIGKGENDEAYYEELLKYIYKNMNAKIFNLVSKLSIAESFQVIKNAKLFIGADSGMSHAAYIMDKISIIIYGGGNYGMFLHEDKNMHYVTNVQECFECNWYCDNVNTEGKPRCIDDIKSERIIDEIKSIEVKL